MLSPFAAAAQSVMQRPQPGGMPNAPGMAPGQPGGGPGPGQQQGDPMAALAALQAGGPPNPNERALLTTSSAGFLDGVPASNSNSPTPILMDTLMQDQIQNGFPPTSESFLRMSPDLYRPDGPFSQQPGGGMSLASQLQQGAASPRSLSPQQQLQPAQPGGAPMGGTMGQGNSQLLQALMGR